jgi:CRISPR/Cas system-associated endonuclease Cas3-HD
VPSGGFQFIQGLAGKPPWVWEEFASRGSNMLRERCLLALGGLLHDIGKVVRQYGPCSKNYEGEFEYQHACLSYQFIEENLKDRLKKEDYKIVEKVLSSLCGMVAMMCLVFLEKTFYIFHKKV